MRVVSAVQSRRTIISMILVETYRALSRCARGQAHFFTGAAILLQFWSLHHLRRPRQVFPHCWFRTDLIEEINQEARLLDFPSNIKDWARQLGTSRGGHFIWFIGWANPHCAMIRGDQHPFLPLIGLNGVVPYAPSRILRQLGWTQDIPLVGNMMIYSFDYPIDTDGSRFLATQEAWGDCHIFDSPETTMDGVSSSTSHDYEAWLDSTLAGRTMSRAITLMGQEPPGPVGYIDYVAEASLRIQRMDEARLLDEQRMRDAHLLEEQRLIAEAEAQRALTVQQAMATAGQTSRVERAERLLEFIADSLTQTTEGHRGNFEESWGMHCRGAAEILMAIREHRS
uniref:Aminotransferase-like plant mobile domain-containing protein n=1 Tax=Davidia involucrata TaxID=16924 RepID=A0A5B6ZPK6_DAVIN